MSKRAYSPYPHACISRGVDGTQYSLHESGGKAGAGKGFIPAQPLHVTPKQSDTRYSLDLDCLA